jgi:hypothetical protein
MDFSRGEAGHPAPSPRQKFSAPRAPVISSAQVAYRLGGGRPGVDSSVLYTQPCPLILTEEYVRTHCGRLLAMLRL